ncbi:hypothetical protein K4K94_15260 [Phaeobacter inhibens]|uniref:hypothetical protein n=1 Tax=Phaeobacter inhibens TaxID=221822 RepID=UPI0021A5BE86|nr:hypothetical protein [Phaeobacter inhibens]UWS03643.1 hypothetical protein K4K94_15260 [Phaeobacter inhibens]
MSRIDFLTFLMLPTFLGLLAWYFGVELAPEVFSVSISVFSIFSALLFSAQVAMYGVFRSDRKATGDAILEADAQQEAQDARELLREVNANVSYLIFVSCLAVTTFLIFFAAPIPCQIEAGLLIAIYCHFLLTVAMVLKRAHEIFDSEYAKPLRFNKHDDPRA